MLRRTRSDRPQAPEPYDARRERAAREEQQAQQMAREWSQVPPVVRDYLTQPTPPAAGAAAPLERYLAALVGGTVRGPAMPPSAIARTYDADLAARVARAEETAVYAVDVAVAWQRGEPGGPGFAALLESGDDETIEEHLVSGRHRSWLRAWRAQQAVQVAEADARAYAAHATELHDSLEAEMSALVAEIAPMFEQVGKGDHRLYDDAWGLVAQWRIPAALRRWCAKPTAAYRVFADHILPPEVVWREWDAHGRLHGRHRPAVPLEAVDAPVPAVHAIPSEGTAVTTKEGTTTITAVHRDGR